MRTTQALLAAAVLAALCSAPAAAQPEQRPPPQGRQQYGPWNRDLELWESADGGKTFTRRGTFVERAGVPCLARTGRLYAAFQWFPLDKRKDFDSVAVMTSDDDGRTWSKPKAITLEGLPDNLYRCFDPTLAALEDGRVRLYFTSERGNEYDLRGNRAIFSAVSTDGYRYKFEDGERFGLTYRETYDVAVAKLGTTWHLYCPMEEPGRGYHAVSVNGRDFVRQLDVTVSGDRRFLGAVLADGGGLRFYGTGAGGGWIGFSADGNEWKVEEAGRFGGADPGAVVTKDGRVLLVTTGKLRSDASPGPAFPDEEAPY